MMGLPAVKGRSSAKGVPLEEELFVAMDMPMPYELNGGTIE